MTYIVILLVVFIVFLQVRFFRRNLKRMDKFANIFAQNGKWQLFINEEDHSVEGIDGRGNEIWGAIKDSINKYLAHNKGSIIHFDILKDAVDRHCDAEEDGISTQLPVPLYLGLAGTMLGVIIGLWNLLSNDAIASLLMGGDENMKMQPLVAESINGLLEGVAWAMVASLVGILLTTRGSLRFRSRKQQMESGKNAFLAWMQSRLLPSLPTNTAEAMGKMVSNLNRFNNTFKENTARLQDILSTMNDSYEKQAEIIQLVHDMDVQAVATANIKVLKALQDTTPQLEAFNNYLMAVEGYTRRIREFEQIYNDYEDRVRVLEEIRDFFNNNKGAMAKSATEIELAFHDAIKNMKERSMEQFNTLEKNMEMQQERFERMMQRQTDHFEEASSKMLAVFDAQMQKTPAVAEQITALRTVPEELQNLSATVLQSNQELIKSVKEQMGLMSSDLRGTLAWINKAIEEVNRNGSILGMNRKGRGFALADLRSWITTVAVVLIALCLLLIVAAMFRHWVNNIGFRL